MATAWWKRCLGELAGSTLCSSPAHIQMKRDKSEAWTSLPSLMYSFIHSQCHLSVTMQMRLYMYLQCIQTFTWALTNMLHGCYHRDHLSCRLKFTYEVRAVWILICMLCMGAVHVQVMFTWILLCLMFFTTHMSINLKSEQSRAQLGYLSVYTTQNIYSQFNQIFSPITYYLRILWLVVGIRFPRKPPPSDVIQWIKTELCWDWFSLC